jgi:tetratricopeptide (TPR) repeat protein
MADGPENKLSRETIQRKVEYAVRLTLDERYEEALPLFLMYIPLLSSGGDDDTRALAAVSSHCGLCLAMVKHRYAEALEYCNISLQRDIMNPEHHANAALVYLERDDRKHAVKHLHEGLRLQSNHKRINQILDDIGRRRKPVLRFLGREHPINVLLGKMRGNPNPRRHGRPRTRQD